MPKRTLKAQNLINKAYVSSVFTFLYLPLAIAVIFSFNASERSSIWKGFTLEWYQQLIQDNDLIIAAGHSLLVSTLAATFATIIGSLAAISLFRYQFFFANFYTVCYLC